MKLRKNITSVISVLLVVAAIYFLWDIFDELSPTSRHNRSTALYYILPVIMALLLSLIGFLSTRNWIKYFIAGNIKINLASLIIGTVLLIIGAIPSIAWVMTLGIRGNIAMILATPATHYVVSVIAGVAIGRSFGHKQTTS